MTFVSQARGPLEPLFVSREPIPEPTTPDRAIPALFLLPTIADAYRSVFLAARLHFSDAGVRVESLYPGFLFTASQNEPQRPVRIAFDAPIPCSVELSGVATPERLEKALYAIVRERNRASVEDAILLSCPSREPMRLDDPDLDIARLCVILEAIARLDTHPHHRATIRVRTRTAQENAGVRGSGLSEQAFATMRHVVERVGLQGAIPCLCRGTGAFAGDWKQHPFEIHIDVDRGTLSSIERAAASEILAAHAHLLPA